MNSWTAAIAALALTPFGSFVDHAKSGPFYGFDAKGPLLNLVRIESIEVPAGNCKALADSMVAAPKSWTELSATTMPELPQSLKLAWSPVDKPLSGKELKSIEGCDDFPCDVKLSKPETDVMAKAKKEARLDTFLKLVAERVLAYMKTQTRSAYETGVPVDPWKALEDQGLKPPLSLPPAPKFYARSLNFDPDKMQTMHQVLDRRAVEAPDPASNGFNAEVWTRDAYTDHYFDGWAEWSILSCENGHALIAEGLYCEMDLLKSTGFFAKLAFGKYRDAFDQNGRIFLDADVERIVKGAAPGSVAH